MENDANDVELLRLAFRFGATPQLEVAYNGREAADVLQADPGVRNTPDLIVCDLNMPIMNGFEFLKWLKLGVAVPAHTACGAHVIRRRDRRGERLRSRSGRVSGQAVQPPGITIAREITGRVLEPGYYPRYKARGFSDVIRATQ